MSIINAFYEQREEEEKNFSVFPISFSLHIHITVTWLNLRKYWRFSFTDRVNRVVLFNDMRKRKINMLIVNIIVS